MQQLPGTLSALREAVAPLAGKVRLWLMDESRFGLRTILRRRITLRGVKPVGRAQQSRGAFWRYGAADALSGASYFRSFLHLCTANFQAFVDDLHADYPDDLHRMLLDNSATHHAHALRLPATLRLHFLPPYSPELNPIERLWQHLKQPLAGRLPASLGELQDQLVPLIDALHEHTVLALITPAWLQDAVSNAGLP